MTPRLEDISTRPVLTVEPDDSLDRVMELMEAHKVRHLPVVEGDRLMGMLSNRDVLTSVGWLPTDQRRSGSGEDAEAIGPVRVSQVMSREVFRLPLDASLGAAAELVVSKKIGAIPLVQEDRLVAIVSDSDLLRALRDRSLDEGSDHPCYHPVRQHMTTQLITMSPTDELENAILAFREWHIRHLPVLEGDELVGMVSDRDVRRALGRESVLDQQAQADGHVLVGRCRIRDVMSDEPVTTHPEATLAEAAHVMLNERVSSLAVMKDDRLMGIITETDLIRVLCP